MSEKERNKRILFMKIGVVFFTILILSIWVFNLKNVWRDNNQTPSSHNQASWSNLKVNWDKTITSIQQQLNKNQQAKNLQKASSTKFLVNLLNNTRTYSSSSSVIKTTATVPVVSTSVSIPTPIPVSSNTPRFISTTSSPLISNSRNCPQYINCMPTIDEPAHSCQIPAGCENITTLVY